MRKPYINPYEQYEDPVLEGLHKAYSEFQNLWGEVPEKDRATFQNDHNQLRMDMDNFNLVLAARLDKSKAPGVYDLTDRIKQMNKKLNHALQKKQAN